MTEEKGVFADMTDAVGSAADETAQAARDVAACVPAMERASRAFEKLRNASQRLGPVPATKQELLAKAVMLAERASWHLRSAQGCLIAGAIRKRERFLQAYRQILRTHEEIRAVADELEERFPGTERDIAAIRESLARSDELARAILEHETDLPFLRTAADGPGPKKPLP
jgi:hypothetical protein